MTDRQKLFWISFWVAVTRIGDGISTYLSSPDLYLEMNPLVRTYGFGWPGLIAAGFVFVLLVLALFYYSYTQRQRFDIPAKSILGYLFLFFFGPKVQDSKAFIRLPKLQSIFTYIGAVFPRVLIFYSLFLITNNLISAASHRFHVWHICRLWLRHQSFTWDYTIISILSIIFTVLLFWGNYRRSKRSQNTP